jgi:hypothetical protein
MARFCEDYPCCGHELGDCDGSKYGPLDYEQVAAQLEREAEYEELYGPGPFPWDEPS